MEEIAKDANVVASKCGNEGCGEGQGKFVVIVAAAAAAVNLDLFLTKYPHGSDM